MDDKPSKKTDDKPSKIGVPPAVLPAGGLGLKLLACG